MSHPVDTLPTPTIPALGWTQERKAIFLERLSAHGNARAACRAVGLSAEAAYKLRRRDPVFARGWAAALVLGREASIQALGERAVEGVEEEIYFRGELVGTRRRFDSRLLLAHLARLDKLADQEGAAVDAGHFDELLAAIAKGEEPYFLRDREYFALAKAEDTIEFHRYSEMDAFYFGDDDGDGDWGPDGGDMPPVDEERERAFLDALQETCEGMEEEALADARRDWDRRIAKVFETVDALDAADRAATRAPAGPPSVPAILLAPKAPEQAPAEPTGHRPFSRPWTLSTASTAALGRGLCGPADTRLATPLSPFSAPRRIGRR